MSPTHLERRLQDDGSSSLWAVGVVLVLAGSVGNNLGNALVALAHKQATQQQLLNEQHEHDGAVAALETGGDRSPRQQPPPSPSLHTQRHERCSLRTIGTIVFVVGSLLTFAAFGFAAQSLLASLESIQFVSNVVFMRYVHKEAISWRILVSTAAIVAGNVLVVIFSNHTAALLTSADLIHLYATNVSYWGYLVCAMVLWFINHLAYSHYYHARVARGVMLWKHSFVEPFTFAVSSAIIGTQAVLNSKCMSMLIQVTSRGIVNEFERPHIWWILVTWIILVAYWLRRLDVGLAMFPPMFIIPVMQVFFVFFAILCGGIFFEEFSEYTVTMYIGFVVGVGMILGGVYGLAPTDVQIQPGKVEAEIASPLVEAAAVVVAPRPAGGSNSGSVTGAGAGAPHRITSDGATGRQLLLIQLEAYEALRSSFVGRTSFATGGPAQDKCRTAAAAAVEAVRALEPLSEGHEPGRSDLRRNGDSGAGGGAAGSGPPAVSSRRPSFASLPHTSPLAPSARSRRSSFLSIQMPSQSPLGTPHKVAPEPATVPGVLTPSTPDPSTRPSPLFTRETFE